MEYGSMTIPIDLGFLMRSPPLSYVSNIYRLAFTDAVWVCSMILCIVATLIIALTFKIRAELDEDCEQLTFSDFFLIATAYLCQMGAEVSAKKLSSKISMVRVERNRVKNSLPSHKPPTVPTTFYPFVLVDVFNRTAFRLLIVYGDNRGFATVDN